MKRRILAVDDEKKWRDNFRSWIKPELALLDVAGTTEEARDLLRQRFYSVVLLDLSMDISDDTNRGNEVLQEYLAKQQEGTQYIIISSTIRKDEIRESLLRRAASDTLFKEDGIDPESLQEILSAALEEVDRRRKTGGSFRSFRSELVRTADFESQLLMALHVKDGAKGLRQIFDALDRVFAPIAVHADRAKLSLGEECVFGLFWSRQLGKAVSIVLSPKTIDMAEARDALGSWLGYEERGEELQNRFFKNVGIQCFEEPNVSAEVFSLPEV